MVPEWLSDRGDDSAIQNLHDKPSPGVLNFAILEPPKIINNFT
jgi:hypothetical protein